MKKNNENKECKFWFLGYCNMFMGGMCRNIECNFKRKEE